MRPLTVTADCSPGASIGARTVPVSSARSEADPTSAAAPAPATRPATTTAESRVTDISGQARTVLVTCR